MVALTSTASCAVGVYSEPQPAPDRESSMAFVTGPAMAAWLEATDKGVVAHAMRSRFPWRCTVHNSCFTHTLIVSTYVNHTQTTKSG